MRAAPQQRANRERDGLHKVLAVVEDKEHVQLREHVGERIRSPRADLASHTDRARDRCDYEVGIAHVRELDPPRAVLRLVGDLGCNLKGETGLSRASPAHDRDQTIRADEVRDGCDLVDPPDEARQLDGKVVAQCVQRLRVAGSRPAVLARSPETRARGARDRGDDARRGRPVSPCRRDDPRQGHGRAPTPGSGHHS